MQTTGIEALLESLSLSKYIPKFQEEEITLEAAYSLSEADLQSIGLPLGPRKALLKALEEKKKSGAGGGGSGGGSGGEIRSKYPPINTDAATNCAELELNCRRNIRDQSTGVDKFNKKLKELLDQDWYFSFDYIDLYRLTKTKCTHRGLHEKLGTVMNHPQDDCYLSAFIANLEEFCKDTLARDTFLAKCPNKVFAFKIVDEVFEWERGDDFRPYGKFSYVDGIFLIEVLVANSCVNIAQINITYKVNKSL